FLRARCARLLRGCADVVSGVAEAGARRLNPVDPGLSVRAVEHPYVGEITADDAAERFERLLDVVGEHVYLAAVLRDGSVRELFQGPGADRLLGGAEPDPEMTNWEAAIHPEDRAAYEAFNASLSAGQTSDVEYRLIGADGVT